MDRTADLMAKAGTETCTAWTGGWRGDRCGRLTAGHMLADKTPRCRLHLSSLERLMMRDRAELARTREVAAREGKAEGLAKRLKALRPEAVAFAHWPAFQRSGHPSVDGNLVVDPATLEWLISCAQAYVLRAKRGA